MLSPSIASFYGRTAECLILRSLLRVKQQREVRIRRNISRLYDSVVQAEKACDNNGTAYRHVIQMTREMSQRLGIYSVEEWQISQQNVIQLRDKAYRLAAQASELSARHEERKIKLLEQEAILLSIIKKQEKIRILLNHVPY